MAEFTIPHSVLGHLLHAFAREEGADLAHRYRESGLANPGDRFGYFFAWAWETNRDLAAQSVAELWEAAFTEIGEADERLELHKVFDGLRFALHHSKYAREEEYEEVRTFLETEVPDWVSKGGV